MKREEPAKAPWKRVQRCDLGPELKAKEADEAALFPVVAHLVCGHKREWPSARLERAARLHSRLCKKDARVRCYECRGGRKA